jgi:DNA replication protein DnaC
MDQIMNRFSSLRLSGMTACWKTLMETRKNTGLSLEDGLALLLQAEQDQRKMNRFNRLEKNARFRYRASLEEVDINPSRGIDKSLLTRLAMGDYIKNGEAAIIVGSTGCGKSFLASSLGLRACEQGFSVAYFNMQKLMMKLKISRLEGTITKSFDKLAKTDLVILDDFGLSALEGQQQLDLMEIIEDRHARKSTIIASQLPVAKWFDVFLEATVADGFLDRIVHTAHRFELKGESLRKKR